MCECVHQLFTLCSSHQWARDPRQTTAVVGAVRCGAVPVPALHCSLSLLGRSRGMLPCFCTTRPSDIVLICRVSHRLRGLQDFFHLPSSIVQNPCLGVADKQNTAQVDIAQTAAGCSKQQRPTESSRTNCRQRVTPANCLIRTLLSPLLMLDLSR